MSPAIWLWQRSPLPLRFQSRLMGLCGVSKRNQVSFSLPWPTYPIYQFNRIISIGMRTFAMPSWLLSAPSASRRANLNVTNCERGSWEMPLRAHSEKSILGHAVRIKIWKIWPSWWPGPTNGSAKWKRWSYRYGTKRYVQFKRYKYICSNPERRKRKDSIAEDHRQHSGHPQRNGLGQK